MSLTSVKSVIKKFAQNDRNDLLTIKGGWGVGKTYFWRKTIEEISLNAEIGHKSYSYISLFGIDSFETLKNSIVANQISALAIGKDINLSGSVLFSKIKQVLKYSEKVPYVRSISGGLASELAFQLVKDSLICFDDLERRSDKLDIKDVLGLASYLKEQRNCKVVLILNDEKLLNKDSFDENNEKVVDLEVNFSPLAEEVFEYIFDKSHPYYDLIKFSCLTLNIKNIRILQRVERFIEDVIPYLEKIEKNVGEDVIRAIVLFVQVYYNKDNETLTFDFLKGFSNIELYLKKDIREEKISPEEEEKYKRLSNYRYGRTDELDKELMLFVQKGYLGDGFFDYLKLRNDEAIAQKGKDSYGEAWEHYKTSFNLDENFFVEKLEKGFRANAKYLLPINLHNTVEILRSLNRNELANELVDEYVPLMIATNEEFLRINYNSFNDFTDEYFLNKVKQIPKASVINLSFEEVLEKLRGNKYYPSENVSRLASFDDSEYFDFFKRQNSELIYYTTKFLLSYGDDTDASPDGKIISEKTKKALQKLASESLINKIRISDWFKLNFDEESRMQ